MLGYWVRPHSNHRTTLYWHWVHKEDPTAYCGIPRPAVPEDEERTFDPLMKCCQKCLARIAREGR